MQTYIPFQSLLVCLLFVSAFMFKYICVVSVKWEDVREEDGTQERWTSKDEVVENSVACQLATAQYSERIIN